MYHPDPRASNKTLLCSTAAVFFIFVVAELIGAKISKSLSLFGDALAMSVDVATYIGNWYAEVIKDRYLVQSYCTKLTVKVAIPAAAVLTLLAVTLDMFTDAVIVLMSPPETDNVKVSFMYFFSILNFFVDAICVALFYIRGGEVFLEKQVEAFPEISLDTSEHEKEEFGHLDDVFDNDIFSNRKFNGANGGGQPPVRNLNMISAFTHVGGDTLRTVSVLIAAMISTIGGINADVCDAWAAIAVSVTIIALLTPLMGNIFKEFKIIRRESNDYAPVEFDDDDENDALVI